MVLPHKDVSGIGKIVAEFLKRAIRRSLYCSLYKCSTLFKYKRKWQLNLKHYQEKTL